jgi:hypothetical protein
MDAKTQHGYLVIADISGFTSYLARVELEHAHEILTDLLETIVKEFKTLLTISKLEGDAVFAYVSEANTPGGERILELIESTYVAFRRQRETSQRNTTCTCKACQSIPSLDLKFFVHHGDYIVQEVSGIRELVGSDVNMIHRLVKNHIIENTGWQAYLLFTSQALQHMDVRPEGLHQQIESYEHLGDIQVLCLDLHARYRAIMTARRVIVSSQEADFSFSIKIPAPVPAVWHYMTDPDKKSQVFKGLAIFTAKSRPGGRSGPGASNHCAHGKDFKLSLVETVLDWRPFDYFTVESIEEKMVIRETYKFEPVFEKRETQLQIFTQVVSMPLPRWAKRIFLKVFMSRKLTTPYYAAAQFIAKERGSETIDPSIPAVA